MYSGAYRSGRVSISNAERISTQLLLLWAITSIPYPSLRMFCPIALMRCPQSAGTVILPRESMFSGTTEYSYVFISFIFFAEAKVRLGSFGMKKLCPIHLFM